MKLVGSVVPENFSEIGTLHSRYGEVAGDIGGHLLDYTGFSLCKTESVDKIWFVDLLGRAVFLYLVIAHFAFKPCTHRYKISIVGFYGRQIYEKVLTAY